MSYPSEKACETIVTIARITAPVRGGQTGYTVYDVVRAMEIMSQGAGRPLLSKELGLGEASIKTMLRRMRDEGLIVRAGRGNTLSSRGLAAFSAINSMIRVVGPLEGFQWIRDAYAIIIYNVNPPVNIVEAIRWRDYLVAHGCREAIVGGLLDDAVIVPGAPVEVARDLQRELLQTVDADRALVYVVPSECVKRGYQAAVDALIDNCKPGG